MRLEVGSVAPPIDAQPICGLRVVTGAAPLAVVFLRSLSGGLARLAVQSLSEAWPRFDAAGVGLVAFTRANLELARDFVPRHHVLFPVVVDTDGRIFDAYGIERDRGFARSALGLRPATVRTAFRALTVGRGAPDGEPDRLPAELLIDRGGAVRYARYGKTVFDLPDVEALWSAARS